MGKAKAKTVHFEKVRVKKMVLHFVCSEKNKESWKIQKYKILYGAAGAAFGISEKDLFWGANWNQILKSGLGESKDTYSIKRGINIYNNSIVGKQNLNIMRYV